MLVSPVDVFQSLPWPLSSVSHCDSSPYSTLSFGFYRTTTASFLPSLLVAASASFCWLFLLQLTFSFQEFIKACLILTISFSLCVFSMPWLSLLLISWWFLKFISLAYTFLLIFRLVYPASLVGISTWIFHKHVKLMYIETSSWWLPLP